ncbi:hypothetical protein, partial [Vibrio coralliilyticus]|uniref:hypothetical protein n=1 Tax=Vibrio coralliilyticus TaxID=190893 RepID=UPI0020A4855A
FYSLLRGVLLRSLGDKPLAATKTLLSRTKFNRKRPTDPMNNPKIFLAALLLLSLVLLGLIAINKPKQTTRVQALVLTQTLTQSLDGNRRFLNIEFSDGDQTMISIPPQTECPANSIVELDKKSALFSDAIGYRYIQCNTYTNKH